jgi:hypothetical protein
MNEDSAPKGARLLLGVAESEPFSVRCASQTQPSLHRGFWWR